MENLLIKSLSKNKKNKTNSVESPIPIINSGISNHIFRRMDLKSEDLGDSV